MKSLKDREPEFGHSQSFLLIVTEESLEPPKVCDYKLRIGVRHARVKVFQSSGGTDIEDMQLEVETRRQQCLIQCNVKVPSSKSADLHQLHRAV